MFAVKVYAIWHLSPFAFPFIDLFVCWLQVDLILYPAANKFPKLQGKLIALQVMVAN